MLVPRRESDTPLPSTLRAPSPSRAQYTPTPPHGQQSPIVQLPALTTYRAHMILMTVLSILAVDFPVFPRSLAKCETYGVSLVGSPQQFHSIASLTVWGCIDGPGCGIVCIFARGSFRDTNYQVSGSSLFPIETKGRQGTTEIPANMGARVLTTNRCEAVRLPCELVPQHNFRPEYSRGILQEHESEYGTHWNFFFTMGTLPILEVLLHPILPFAPVSMIAITIALCGSCHSSCFSSC